MESENNKSDRDVIVTKLPKEKEQKKAAKPEQNTRKLRWQKKLRFQPENVKLKKKEEPRHEYFKNLVGSEARNEIEIPRAICVADRVESSAKEMKAMLKAVSQHTSNRAILQKMPRHMRRRAASHNRKRLPRRLHKLAEEMEAQTPNEATVGKTTKTPNRKKRRRKRDLQNEFAKRSGKHGWLETHTWHAKRFHMTESNDPMYSGWGNRVALFPNDKSFRACYRAVSKHCLIQDISYLGCLHLSGTSEQLLQLMKLISCDAEFDSIVMEGQKENDILLYKSNLLDAVEGATKECIGPASVLWRPACSELEDTKREVLVWIHPTTLSSALEILNLCCDENKLDVKITNMSADLLRFRLTGPKSSVTLLSTLRPLNYLPNREDNKKCLIGEWLPENKDLVDQLHKDYDSVMTDCHKQIFARSKSEMNNDDVPEYPDGSLFPVVTDDPRLTLPLDKVTPTLTNAKKKLVEPETSIEHENIDQQEYDGILCRSPIWNDNMRNQVSNSRLPDHVVSTRKREQKFQTDGKKTANLTLTTAVPIMIIRKALNEERRFTDSEIENKSPHSGPNESFASGWDVIIPHGWATAFWVPLVYHRARAGGLRENKNTCLECLAPHFPQDYPDTECGKLYWKTEANKLANKYYRKPPAKRTNYSVLAVPNPFYLDWKGLFNDKVEICDQTKSLKRAAENDDDVVKSTVPEKKAKLENNDISTVDCDEQIAEYVVESEISSTNGEHRGVNINNNPPSLVFENAGSTIASVNEKLEATQYSVLRDVEELTDIRKWIIHTIDSTSHSANKILLPSQLSTSCQLICVGVKSLNKGIPFSRSMICFPTSEDLDNLCKELTDPYTYGLQSITGPSEPKQWDPYRKERKEAKKVAKKQRKNKKISKVITSDGIAEDESVKKSTQVTASLNQPQQFSVHPCKEVIGYVTSGDFLFSHACGAGIGFVSSQKLRSLIFNQIENENLDRILKDENSRKSLLNDDQHAPLLALMRNTDSVQYRFVKLEIIKPF